MLKAWSVTSLNSYSPVTNEVKGIGQPIFSDATKWGSSDVCRVGCS